MSTVSSISASGLSQYLQALSTTNPSLPIDPTDSTSETSASSSTANVNGTSSSTSIATDPTQIAPHHHHGGHGGGGFFKKLQSAVTSALQTAQDDGSADPNQVVQDAIAKVLQGGDDADGDSASATTSPTDSIDPNTATASTSSSNDAQQAFFQTLQSFGIDPQQFHQDFVAAVQNSQNGQTDPSSVFQNFPPGTLIDTTA